MNRHEVVPDLMLTPRLETHQAHWERTVRDTPETVVEEVPEAEVPTRDMAKQETPRPAMLKEEEEDDDDKLDSEEEEEDKVKVCRQPSTAAVAAAESAATSKRPCGESASPGSGILEEAKGALAKGGVG